MKHSRKILAQLITLVFSMSLVASTAAPTLAAVPKFPGFGPITKDQAKNLGLREETNLIDVVISITKIVLTLASVVALLFIIIAGIRYVPPLVMRNMPSKRKKLSFMLSSGSL